MIRLHYSNRLEELLTPLCASVRASQRKDPLQACITIVPSRLYEDFLRLRLAEACGVAANLEFPFLSRYLAGAINAADSSTRILDTNELGQVIFECLRTLPEHPALTPLREYIGDRAAEPAERELRELGLSTRIARLVREYATSRRAMLLDWRRSADDDPPGLHPDMRWQRFVYRLLFDSRGCLRPRWLADRTLRWLLLPDALDAVSPARLGAALARPLHIFGLAYAGPEFVRIFARLAELTELHLYCLNPCVEYWEDVPRSYLIEGTALVARGSKLAQGVDEREDPFGIGGLGENQALAFWSLPGREYIRLTNELTQCDFESHFALPLQDSPSPSILARLQQAILLRQPALAPSDGDPAQDSSIRILACPGVRREVEIVANAIWSLLRQEGGPSPLRFHQIAVLLPESALPAYLPHLQAVLGEQYGIPLNLAGTGLHSASRVTEAARLLIGLAAGQMSRDEMLRLLAHPALGGPEGAGEQWLRWCEAAGIFFGADERDLAQTYIPPENFNWDQGLRRLALGVFMEDGDPIYRAANDLPYLPLTTAQDESAGAAAFVRKARSLIAEVLDLRSRRATLAQWSEVMRELLTSYIAPAEPADARTLSRCIAALETMAVDELRAEPVSYPAACEAALSAIAQAQAEAGRFAESGVAVGSMSALRSIPLRVIFVAGLGETVFPARDAADPLDLRALARLAGDVSPAQRDRYLFLEALLAARERLVLSYVARDEVTGDQLEPSPVISELIHMLREPLGKSGLEALTIRHPASRYDLNYFPDLGGRGVPESDNFDPMAHRGARLAAMGEDLARHCGSPPPGDSQSIVARLSPPVKEELTRVLRLVQPPAAAAPGALDRAEIVLPLSALRRLLECPLQAGASYRLGMLDDEDDREDSLEDEPVGAPFMPHLALLREAFWQGRGEETAVRDIFESKLERNRLAGQAPAGPFLAAVSAEGLSRLGRGSAQLHELAFQDLSGWQRVRIGGGSQENAESDLRLPPIMLEIQNGGRIWRVSLRATVTLSPARDASYRFVPGRGFGPRDFIDGYLAAFALAAAGHELAPNFRAIALGYDPGKARGANFRRLRPPTKEAAQVYLRMLAHDLLAASHDYFLPFEAVEKIVKSTKGSRASDEQILEAIEGVRGGERCRSDYGPIRNARSFASPPPEIVRDIIQRRFGPLMGIFEKE